MSISQQGILKPTDGACIGTRSTATALQCGKSRAQSIILEDKLKCQLEKWDHDACQCPPPQPRSRHALISPGVSSAMTCNIGGG